MFNLILIAVFMLAGLSSISVRGEAPPESLTLLTQLIEINSHSENPIGLERVRKLVISEFRKLGFMAHQTALDKHHVLTFFDFPGDFPTEKPKLLLIGHIDTVFHPSSRSSVSVGKRGTEGNRIYGPGIIDMKGGIVVMLEVLKKLSFSERKKIRIMINDDEELASVYSKDKIREKVKNIPFGLVFEPGLPDGSLVTSASGGRWIKLKVKGKAAHAGMEHEKGLNACAELAYKLTELHSLTDYTKKLTLNVGVMEGGTQPNVVCEEAQATLDVRYVDPKDMDGVLKKIEEIANQYHVKNVALDYSPVSRLETLALVPSMPESSTYTLFSLAQEVGRDLQIPVRGEHVGYATDGNHLVQTGMQLLVGLGPYGGGLHTDQEFMTRGALEDRILLGIHLIQKILRNAPVRVGEFSEIHGLRFEGNSVGQVSTQISQASPVRLRSLTELMLPSLGNGDRFIPKANGEPFVPAFLSAQLGVDVEFAPSFRLLYLQKGLATYPASSGADLGGRFFDPRMGLRKTKVISIPNFISEYDVFVQPGLVQAAIGQPQRSFDLGLRLVNVYRFPYSQWMIGANFEFVSTFFKGPSAAADRSGVFAGYASYRISRFFATQHWFYSFYKHQRGDPFFKVSWDLSGGPYLQNGISLLLFQEVVLSLLVNQYAFELPQFSKMWASLWVNIAVN